MKASLNHWGCTVENLSFNLILLIAKSIAEEKLNKKHLKIARPVSDLSLKLCTTSLT